MKTCPYGGKVSYTTEKAAKIARKTLSKSKNVKDFRIYKCPNCFHYHFTTAKN